MNQTWKLNLLTLFFFILQIIYCQQQINHQMKYFKRILGIYFAPFLPSPRSPNKRSISFLSLPFFSTVCLLRTIVWWNFFYFYFLPKAHSLSLCSMILAIINCFPFLLMMILEFLQQWFCKKVTVVLRILLYFWNLRSCFFCTI